MRTKQQDKSNLKRYHLEITQELYDELQRVAVENNTSVKGILQRFISIGLLVERVSKSPDADFIIREGETERIVFFA